MNCALVNPAHPPLAAPWRTVPWLDLIEPAHGSLEDHSLSHQKRSAIITKGPFAPQEPHPRKSPLTGLGRWDRYRKPAKTLKQSKCEQHQLSLSVGPKHGWINTAHNYCSSFDLLPSFSPHLLSNLFMDHRPADAQRVPPNHNTRTTLLTPGQVLEILLEVIPHAPPESQKSFIAMFGTHLPGLHSRGPPKALPLILQPPLLPDSLHSFVRAKTYVRISRHSH